MGKVVKIVRIGGNAWQSGRFLNDRCCLVIIILFSTMLSGLWVLADGTPVADVSRLKTNIRNFYEVLMSKR